MSNNYSNELNSNAVRIHGQSSALKDLLKVIDDPKINSLEDVLQFRRNYAIVRQKKIDDSIAQVKLQITKMIADKNQLTLERDKLIESKSEELNQKIAFLQGELIYPYSKCNFLETLYREIKRWVQDRKIKYVKNELQTILSGIKTSYDRRIASIDNKIQYEENNVQLVAKDNISKELSRLDELYNTIEKEKHLIYGAIGETKVMGELRKLPSAYHVINDFRSDFYRPIFNRAENDRIYSIQVDHLVVGPTGIFIIETKYWSNQSISNEMLFSPVKQVKRSGFALFVVLNDAIRLGNIKRLVNNWGERKISPKQIVASVNNVPHGEFQYVKVLGIDKLNSYITYGKQEFNTEEIQDIVNYLMHAN